MIGSQVDTIQAGIVFRSMNVLRRDGIALAPNLLLVSPVGLTGKSLFPLQPCALCCISNAIQVTQRKGTENGGRHNGHASKTNRGNLGA